MGKVFVASSELEGLKIISDHYSFFDDTFSENLSVGGVEDLFPNSRVVRFEGNHLKALVGDNINILARVVDEEIVKTKEKLLDD